MTQTNIDVKPQKLNKLNQPNFDTLAKELALTIKKRVQLEGPAENASVRTHVEDLIEQKKKHGELSGQAITDNLHQKVLEEYKKIKKQDTRNK